MVVMIADTACVDPRTELADGVEIGPYCVVGPHVRLAPGARLVSHVCLTGPLTIGAGTVIHPFAVLGGDPETGGPAPAGGSIEIGDHCRIGEGAVIHPPSSDSRLTRLGSYVRLGPHVHLAGACELESHVNLAGGVRLAAQVKVGTAASLTAGVTVHPRVSIGAYAFVGGPTRVFHDVPPYMLADGHPARLRGLNLVGLKRAEVPASSLAALHEAYRLLYRARIEVDAAAQTLAAHNQRTPEVNTLLDAVRAQRAGKHGRVQDRLHQHEATTSLLDDPAL